LYEDVGFITFIKLGSFKWGWSFFSNGPAKRILNAKPDGKRKRGRSKVRWEDGVENYIKALGERHVRNLGQEQTNLSASSKEGCS
jgi:hypothetical protein